ncbi:hypothetical protein V6Z12_A11G308700 [Gossypium hirsutum]
MLLKFGESDGYKAYASLKTMAVEMEVSYKQVFLYSVITVARSSSEGGQL